MARQRQTHCKRGHKFSAENTYFRLDGRVHSCAICNRLRAKKRYRTDEEFRRTRLQQLKGYRDRKRFLQPKGG